VLQNSIGLFQKKNFRTNQYEKCELGGDPASAIFTQQSPIWGSKDVLEISFQELPISTYILKGTVSFLVQVGLGEQRDSQSRLQL